ncbi:MAG: hypothetical protein WD175_01005 [Candidatus Paceibacterota bacterium]
MVLRIEENETGGWNAEVVHEEDQQIKVAKKDGVGGVFLCLLVATLVILILLAAVW